MIEIKRKKKKECVLFYKVCAKAVSPDCRSKVSVHALTVNLRRAFPAAVPIPPQKKQKKPQ